MSDLRIGSGQGAERKRILPCCFFTSLRCVRHCFLAVTQAVLGTCRQDPSTTVVSRRTICGIALDSGAKICNGFLVFAILVVDYCTIKIALWGGVDLNRLAVIDDGLVVVVLLKINQKRPTG